MHSRPIAFAGGPALTPAAAHALVFRSSASSQSPTASVLPVAAACDAMSDSTTAALASSSAASTSASSSSSSSSAPISSFAADSHLNVSDADSASLACEMTDLCRAMLTMWPSSPLALWGVAVNERDRFDETLQQASVLTLQRVVAAGWQTHYHAAQRTTLAALLSLHRLRLALTVSPSLPATTAAVAFSPESGVSSSTSSSSSSSSSSMEICFADIAEARLAWSRFPTQLGRQLSLQTLHAQMLERYAMTEFRMLQVAAWEAIHQRAPSELARSVLSSHGGGGGASTVSASAGVLADEAKLLDALFPTLAVLSSSDKIDHDESMVEEQNQVSTLPILPSVVPTWQTTGRPLVLLEWQGARVARLMRVCARIVPTSARWCYLLQEARAMAHSGAAASAYLNAHILALRVALQAERSKGSANDSSQEENAAAAASCATIMRATGPASALCLYHLTAARQLLLCQASAAIRMDAAFDVAGNTLSLLREHSFDPRKVSRSSSVELSLVSILDDLCAAFASAATHLPWHLPAVLAMTECALRRVQMATDDELNALADSDSLPRAGSSSSSSSAESSSSDAGGTGTDDAIPATMPPTERSLRLRALQHLIAPFVQIAVGRRTREATAADAQRVATASTVVAAVARRVCMRTPSQSCDDKDEAESAASCSEAYRVLFPLSQSAPRFDSDALSVSAAAVSSAAANEACQRAIALDRTSWLVESDTAHALHVALELACELSDWAPLLGHWDACMRRWRGDVLPPTPTLLTFARFTLSGIARFLLAGKDREEMEEATVESVCQMSCDLCLKLIRVRLLLPELLIGAHRMCLAFEAAQSNQHDAANQDVDTSSQQQTFAAAVPRLFVHAIHSACAQLAVRPHQQTLFSSFGVSSVMSADARLQGAVESDFVSTARAVSEFHNDENDRVGDGSFSGSDDQESEVELVLDTAPCHVGRLLEYRGIAFRVRRLGELSAAMDWAAACRWSRKLNRGGGGGTGASGRTLQQALAPLQSRFRAVDRPVAPQQSSDPRVEGAAIPPASIFFAAAHAPVELNAARPDNAVIELDSPSLDESIPVPDAAGLQGPSAIVPTSTSSADHRMTDGDAEHSHQPSETNGISRMFD
jgi:hypothetical protein